MVVASLPALLLQQIIHATKLHRVNLASGTTTKLERAMCRDLVMQASKGRRYPPRVRQGIQASKYWSRLSLHGEIQICDL